MRALGRAAGDRSPCSALLALLRELFPDRPLLTRRGRAVCAFQPVFTWISGGVNPDALLIPLGAVLFWLFARAFRRGLTLRLAVGLGLADGARAADEDRRRSAAARAPCSGVALLLWRARAVAGRRAAARLAAALAAGVARAAQRRPVEPAGAADGLIGRGGVGEAAPRASRARRRGCSSFATYLWQYVLPRVGSMTDFFHSGWTPKDFWMPLFVGRFGWFDYGFPTGSTRSRSSIYAVIAVAALVALVPLAARRDAIVGADLRRALRRADRGDREAPAIRCASGGNYLFEQARYVLPLLGLYAFALGLALSLLRRRALVAVTSIAVALSAVHLLAAFVLTVRRYYL